MIPYQELCDALARSRAKQGVSNRPAAAPAPAPLPAAPAAPTSTPAFVVRSAAPRQPSPQLAIFASATHPSAPPPSIAPPGTFDRTVESDISELPPMPSAEPASAAPTPVAKRDDITNEIDIDGLDVVGEEPL